MPQLLMRSFPGRCSIRAAAPACGGRSNTGGSAACRGASRNPRTGLPIARATTSTGVRRSRARVETRPGERPGGCPVRHRARQPRHTVGGRRELRRLARLGLDGRFGFYEALDYNPRAGDRSAARRRAASRRSSAPSLRTIRACRSSRWRTSSATTPSSRVFTPIRASRPRSCSSRSACRARRSFRSRVRPRASRREPGAACLRVETVPVAAHDERPHAFLSNGRYTTAGHQRRRRVQHVARHRGHPAPRRPTSDSGAHYIYLRDPWSDRVWSATYHPVCEEPDRFDATFDLEKITFRRRDTDIETRLEITVSSGRRRRGAAADDHQPRLADARDRSDQLRRDRAGTPGRRSRASGLRQAVRRDGIRPPERRPAVQPPAARAADESPIVGFHVLGVDGRARRRGRVGNRPRALHRPRPLARQSDRARRPALSGTTGAVLDPIGALRERMRLPPARVVRVTFATGVAADRAAALALARKYRDGSAPRARSRWRSPTSTSRCSTWGSATSRRCSSIASRRGFGATPRASARRTSPPTRSGSRTCGGYGISGDLPIVLLRVADGGRCRWCGSCCNAQEYWRVKGCAPMSSSSTSTRPIIWTRCRAALSQLVQEPRWAGWNESRAACSCSARTACPKPIAICSARSRVVLRGELGDLVSQLERPSPWLFDEHDVPRRSARRAGAGRDTPLPVPPLVMENGSAASRPTAASTSSSSTASARRRAVVERAGQRHFGTIVSARGRRSPGPATAARTG